MDNALDDKAIVEAVLPDVIKSRRRASRDGSEFEFTTWFDVDRQHIASTSKDRTGLFAEPAIITEETGEMFARWLKTLDGKGEREDNSPIHWAPENATVGTPTGDALERVGFNV